MTDRAVSVERVIPAAAERIFDVLADPKMHPVIDGSGSVRRTIGGQPVRLRLGATFGMAMRIGIPYAVRNTVVEFEEGRRIAWRHLGGHRWRYELTPVVGGTLVRETFDWTTHRAPWFIDLSPFPERNRRGMEKTLERLEKLVVEGLRRPGR
jgi:uncharacterized protein YndB with AHSA1/START domain